MTKVGDVSWCGRSLLVVVTLFAALGPIVAQQRDPLDLIQKQPLGPAVLGKGATVLVLDQAEEPVAGAAVSVVPRAALFEAQTRERLASLGGGRGFDLEEATRRIAAANGRRYVTDPNGETRIPNDEAQLVVAVSGRRVGDRLITAGETDVEIILEQRDEAAVRVSDAAGKPVAGVPVTVAMSAYGVAGRDSAIYWTDEQGVAYVPHLSMFSVEQVHLGLLCVDSEVQFEAIEVARFVAPEPIELQAPEFGALKVICYDRNELVRAPRLSSAEIVIAHRESGHARFFTAAVIEPDSALFPCVALGQDFRVRLTFADGSQREVSGDGPKRPREITILTDTFDDSHTLTCDLVDASGAALERAKTTLVLRAGSDLESFDRTTDEAGRLAFVIPPVFADRDIELYLLQQRPARDGRLAACLGLDATHPSRMRGALGRIELTPEPILLSGVVVDASGAAVTGIPVLVRDAFRGADTDPWFSRIGVWRHDVERTFEVGARTDQEGRFELRHISRVPPAIEIDDRNWLMTDAPALAVGDRDVRVSVVRAGSLRGRLVDPPDDPDMIRIHLHDGGAHHHFPQLAADGSFHADGLMPGTYRVELGDRALVIEGVEIESGVECADERVQALRWRDAVDVLELTVEFDGGEVPDWIYLATIQNTPEQRIRYLSLPSVESTSIVVPKGGDYRLAVAAQGFVAQILEAPRGSAKATLQPQRSVHVHFVGELDLPSDVQAWLRFSPQTPNVDAAIMARFVDRASTLLRGRAEAEVVGAGKYDFHLELRWQHADGWQIDSQVQYPFRVLEVVDGAETLEYRVEIDDALRQKIVNAIEDLRSRVPR